MEVMVKINHLFISINIFLAILTMASFLNAATYYVDATAGNDSRTNAQVANPATPWKTIAKINSLTTAELPPGSTVYLKCGETWRETLIVRSSGFAGSPITFSSYGTGEKPVINGAKLVTSAWTETYGGSHKWQTAATITTEPHIVAFNGLSGAKVASLNDVTGAGKWHWASGVITVYSTSDPATAFATPGVEAGFRQSGIDLNGKHYITISNLAIKLTNHNAITHNSNHSDNITIDSCNISDIAVTGISAYHGAENWVISNNTITNIARGVGGVATGDAMYLDMIEGTELGEGSNFSVYGNTIIKCGGSGIRTGGSGHHINKNYIKDASYCIEINSTTTDVYNNEVCECNSTFAAVTSHGVGINGNTFRYNKIYNNKGSGIALQVGTGHNVYGNIIYGHGSGANPCGIRFASGGGANTNVYNNTIFNNTRGIQVDAAGTTGLVIKNNILSSNSAYGIRSFGTQIVTNNDVWNSATKYSGNISDQTNINGNISQDPKFVSTSTPDFHLQTTSPCIDAATDVGLKQDYDGKNKWGSAWDIGAYECNLSISAPKNLMKIR
jgi:hypothetical protein